MIFLTLCVNLDASKCLINDTNNQKRSSNKININLLEFLDLNNYGDANSIDEVMIVAFQFG